MSWFQWSKTAANNSVADPTINWSEGQSPSSVNDSARAMMAAAASWRDDVSGALTTTGTGTALVLASNQVFDTTAHMNNAMIAFVPNVTNTGAVTLAVDGLAAKPIRSQTGSSGNLGAGVLVAGTPYIVSYYDSAGEFILQGFVGQPFSVPLGAMLPYTGAAAPNSNFVFPFGQAISRTTYATYFALVGTTFGVGDGVTTFNIPDLRGFVIAGVDNMGGSAANRLTFAISGVNTGIGAAGGTEGYTLLRSNLPNVTLNLTGNLTNGTINIGDSKFDLQAVRADIASVNVLKTGGSSLGITAALASTALTGATDSINANVTQTVFSRVQPTMELNFILRIL